jgi:hypothetical protein
VHPASKDLTDISNYFGSSDSEVNAIEVEFIRASDRTIRKWAAAKLMVLSDQLNRKLLVSITIIYLVCRVSCRENEDEHTGKALQA